MLYDCECGCGEKIEKTIAFSTACRMRIRRGSVTKDNSTVTKRNTVVTKDNKDVIERNKDVTIHNTDTIEVVTEGACPTCKREGKETEEGFYCPRCNKNYE